MGYSYKKFKKTSIVNAFQKIISAGRKPDKIWVYQGSEFYDNSFKYFLKLNNIEMYSTYNEGKSVAAKRFIRHFQKYQKYQNIKILKLFW